MFEAFSGCISIGGILLIILLMQSRLFAKLAESGPGKALHRLWSTGWELDRLYDLLLVHPYVLLARINRSDVIDCFYIGIGRLSQLAWRGLVTTENGRVRSFVLGIVLGAAVFIGLAVFL